MKRMIYACATVFLFSVTGLSIAGDVNVNGKISVINNTNSTIPALDATLPHGKAIIYSSGGLRPTLELEGDLNSNAPVLLNLKSTDISETISIWRTLELRNYHTTTAGEEAVTSGITGDLMTTGATISDLGGRLRFITKNAGLTSASTKMTITGDGSVGINTIQPAEKLDVVGNIHATGTITQGSSREFKKDIESLTIQEALNTVRGLEPIKYNYKADDRDMQIGFIAEDVPDLVATPDRKSLNSMDIVAVLTKVVQEQQKIIDDQQKLFDAQKETINTISLKLNELERIVNTTGGHK